jgi:hypothetical protein
VSTVDDICSVDIEEKKVMRGLLVIYAVRSSAATGFVLFYGLFVTKTMQKQNATGICNGIQLSERAHFNMPGHLKEIDLTMATVQYLRRRCEKPWRKSNLNRIITVCIRSKQHKGQNIKESRIGES